MYYDTEIVQSKKVQRGTKTVTVDFRRDLRGFSASWRAVPNHNLLPNSWGLGWVFPVSHYRVVMVTAKNYQFWVAFSSVFGSQANRQFCPFWKTQYVRVGVRGENVKKLQFYSVSYIFCALENEKLFRKIFRVPMRSENHNWRPFHAWIRHANRLK